MSSAKFFVPEFQSECDNGLNTSSDDGLASSNGDTKFLSLFDLFLANGSIGLSPGNGLSAWNGLNASSDDSLASSTSGLNKP